MSKTIVAAVLAASLLAVPAAHAKGAAAGACAVTPALEHPFAPWGDHGFYVLHPGGDMETGLSGWTLSGGAAVVAGDDGLGVLGGTHVLSLPPGATAVTAPICVDETYTHARFAGRARAGAALDVDVLYADAKGKAVSKGSKRLKAVTGAWAPSANVDIDAKLAGAAPVRFRFAAPRGSSWLIDDFYVDPRFRS